MELASVPSQDCLCNDDQQKSGSDTKNVGFWLEEPTFTHGQLYAAKSRVGDHQRLNFTLNKRVSRKTKNFVFREIL